MWSGREGKEQNEKGEEVRRGLGLTTDKALEGII